MFLSSSIEAHLPQFLASADRAGLMEAIKQFGDTRKVSYYLDDPKSEYGQIILQGDGWPAFNVNLYPDGEPKQVRAIVLSNSCDISPDNKRHIAASMVICPLVKLGAYLSLLEAAKVDQERIHNTAESIRRQEKTEIFYLPPGSGLSEEYVARLDQVHHLPAGDYNQDLKKQKLFTLSQIGHYLLLMKLSIHFCRMQENLLRV